MQFHPVIENYAKVFYKNKEYIDEGIIIDYFNQCLQDNNKEEALEIIQDLNFFYDKVGYIINNIHINNFLVSDYVYDNIFHNPFEDKFGELNETNRLKKIQLYDNENKENQVEHIIPAKSLVKVKEKNGMSKIEMFFDFLNKQNIQNETFIILPKYDGSSVVLEIDKTGNLVSAATRGDGEKGVNITSKVDSIKTIPNSINIQPLIKYFDDKDIIISVRGEAIIKDKVFKENDTLKENFANSRIAVSAILNNKEISEFTHFVDFVAFDMVVLDKDKNILPFNSSIDKMNLMKECGLSLIAPYEIFDLNIEENIEELKKKFNSILENEKIDENYFCDGIVIVPNHKDFIYTRGSDENPKFWRAFKPDDIPMISKAVTIYYDEDKIGVNGQITPVLIMEPVLMEDPAGGEVTIQKCTLHNMKKLNELIDNGFGKKSEFTLIRSGDVIPKFVNQISTSTEVFSIPTSCPICSGSVEQDGAHLFCQNPQCKGKQKKQLEKFTENMKGIGGKVLSQLYDKGFIKYPIDLFKLYQYKDEILKLPGFQEKKVNNLLNLIQKNSEFSLVDYLASLDFRDWGSKNFEKAFQEKLIVIENNVLVVKKDEIPGIKTKMVTKLKKGLKFYQEHLTDILTQTNNYNLILPIEKTQSNNQKKKIVISGSVPLINDKKYNKNTFFKDFIEPYVDAELSKDVSKDSDLLITIENNNKKTKAEKYNIPVLTFDEVIEKIKNDNLFPKDENNVNEIDLNIKKTMIINYKNPNEIKNTLKKFNINNLEEIHQITDISILENILNELNIKNEIKTSEELSNQNDFNR